MCYSQSNRKCDRSVYSRDLIDLSILKQRTDFPRIALTRAEAAYTAVEPPKRSIYHRSRDKA
ncbi:hypothetical protein S7335_4182 [Synechococcus sp. PCC 7335]|nr:hypothetical protein S7335_4182 [Synechococcus sp. PCC 7335]